MCSEVRHFPESVENAGQEFPPGNLCAALVSRYVPGCDLFVPLEVGGETYQALLDPGSASTLLSKAHFPVETLPGYVTEVPPGTRLRDASCQSMAILGSCVVLLKAGSRQARLTALVVKQLPAPAFIGLDAMSALGVSVLSTGGAFRIVVGGAAAESVTAFILEPLRAVAILSPADKLARAQPTRKLDTGEAKASC